MPGLGPSDEGRAERHFTVALGPRQRVDPAEDPRQSNPRARRQRQVFRVTYCTVIAEWSTAFIAVGLLSFYLFAVFSAGADQRDGIHYRLLVAYVLMSSYMRICYVLTTMSKTYLLWKQGPCESTTLPGQKQINTVSGLMFLVEPAHFICLCWITHVAFPLVKCDEGVTQNTCISLHIASTIFVSMWILTGVAIVVLICTVTFLDGNRHNNSRWWEDTLGSTRAESALRLTALPDPLREQIIGNLPTTSEPPADGEPCAICFEVDTQDEWRVLPCGHRFHPACVDNWLKMHHGTCPTCRRDPTQGAQPASFLGNAHGASDTFPSESSHQLTRERSSDVRDANGSTEPFSAHQVAWRQLPTATTNIATTEADDDEHHRNWASASSLGGVLHQMIAAGTAPPNGGLLPSSPQQLAAPLAVGETTPAAPAARPAPAAATLDDAA